MFDHILEAKVNKRKAESLYRERVVRQSLVLQDNAIFFSDNNYLGLSNHPKVVKAFQQAVERYGVGSTSSPLLVGYHETHRDLEIQLAEFLHFPRVLLFSCGYMANLGVINALCGRHDTILLDRICHASMIDAVQLSRANLLRYGHVDMNHLSTLLSCDSSQKLIVSEGVFGMDGDIAPVPALSLLAKQHQAGLLIDDAHGFGILGESGRGVLSHYGLTHQAVDIYLGTFGKAFGAYGAFAAGSERLIDALIQLSRPYMFSTATPPALAAAVSAGLRVMQDEPWRREQLNALILAFQQRAVARELPILPSNTPIQILMVGDALRAQTLGAQLQAAGLMVSVIRPPTVPEGTSRLRISLNISHSVADIERLLDTLVVLTNKVSACV